LLTDGEDPRGADGDDDVVEPAEPVNYAALEFELQRMRKRLAIWEIFMGYMKQGADTWPKVQHALSQEDREEIDRICDGLPLGEVLLDYEEERRTPHTVVMPPSR
jgi:hypothetical protein